MRREAIGSILEGVEGTMRIEEDDATGMHRILVEVGGRAVARTREALESVYGWDRLRSYTLGLVDGLTDQGRAR